ncbi:hypothetical protein PDE_01745 [Penicillium oxalicum 114-2]|uniref:DNA replication regulator SLD2 n=1 Tax=Penicillium oxalicum (strain 114-2 / CGMCC 5302) TaxID=933388 RepID=S7ZDQ3_PENO1|nr:hypothetical protein PDE_01745 [Penicillium oxalicum 114-2]
MADYALQSSTDVAAKALDLRAELKAWEKAFAATHQGRKAGREDIKQHPDIASKYKEYGRLKALESTLSRRENRQGPLESQSRKRRHASPSGPEAAQSITTPRKAAKGIFATPTNNRIKHEHQVDEFVSPVTFRKLFSPSSHQRGASTASPLKAAIGPTPQRDGKALGLFDMLSESGGSGATPSAKKQRDFLAAGFNTPSRGKMGNKLADVPEVNEGGADEEEEGQEEHARLSRTPASSTKQFYLANLFATPTTMRYAAMVEAKDGQPAQDDLHSLRQGATSPEPNTSDTPSFLRRTNFNRLPPPTSHIESVGLSPIAARKPLKFAAKGLSHLVQGLREMEEDREDDEWDMLREIEAEQEAHSFQVAQSQQVPQEGRPYKKKGQKRTTRRVVMRPVLTRPKKSDPAPIENDEDTANEDAEVIGVLETQLPAGSEVIDEASNVGYDETTSLHTVSDAEDRRPVSEEPDLDSDDDSEFGGSSKPLSRPKSFSERIKEAVSMAKPAPKEEPRAEPKKAPLVPQAEATAPKTRMIKANARVHTNYRSLKIHHRGSTQARGRFRRR